MTPIPTPLMEALLWTLLHSLWIGAGAAGLAALVLQALRRSAASLRYQVLLSCGLLFLFGTAFSAWRELSERAATGQAQSPAVVTTATTGAAATAPAATSWMEGLEGWISGQAPWLLALWLLIVVLRGLQLAVSLRAVHRLRHRGLVEVEGEWLHRLAALATAMGLSRLPAFKASYRVQVPVVVGYFKPLLLVPVGWLTSLPPEEVEAILVHELAHIRRADYLVNTVQYVAEALFFFNPGLRWISAQLRQEREHCCDDEAIARGADRRAYAAALLSFGEVSVGLRPATALNGGHSLRDRVHRLLFHHDKNVTPMEKMSLAAALLATVVTAYAFGQVRVPQPPPPPTAPQVAVPAPPAPEAKAIKVEAPAAIPAAPPQVAIPPDPPALSRAIVSIGVDTPGKHLDYHMRINEKEYRFRLMDGKFAELYEDGQVIPPARYSEFGFVLEAVKEHQKLAEEHRAMATRHAETQREHAVRMKEHAVAMEKHRVEQAEHAKTMERHAVVSRERQALAEEHAVRAREHQREAKEHQMVAKEHEQRARAHKAALDGLAAEGLIKKGFSAIEKRQDGKMYVDGTVMSEEAARRYATLLKEALKKQSAAGSWQ